MAHAAQMFSQVGTSLLLFHQVEEHWCNRLVKIVADGGCCGELIGKTKAAFG